MKYEIYRNGKPTNHISTDLKELKKDLADLKAHPDNKNWIKAKFEILGVEE